MPRRKPAIMVTAGKSKQTPIPQLTRMLVGDEKENDLNLSNDDVVI